MASNERMIGERWIGEEVEGRGRVLYRILSLHLPGGTEERHEQPYWGQPVSGPRFEPGTSQIRSRNVIYATTTFGTTTTTSDNNRLRLIGNNNSCILEPTRGIIIIWSSAFLCLSTAKSLAERSFNFQCKSVILFAHCIQYPVLPREANTSHFKPHWSLKLVAFCFVYRWMHLEFTRGESRGFKLIPCTCVPLLLPQSWRQKDTLLLVHSSSKYICQNYAAPQHQADLCVHKSYSTFCVRNKILL
jgi:hypothetical protein